MANEKCKNCKRALVLDEENLCAYCELSQEKREENSINVNCGVCKVIVEEDSEGLFCEVCNSWFHNKCNKTPLNYELYALLNEAPDNVKWFCDKCIWKTEKWMKEINNKHCQTQGKLLNVNSKKRKCKSNGKRRKENEELIEERNNEAINDEDSEGINEEETEELPEENLEVHSPAISEIKMEIDEVESVLTEEKKEVKIITQKKKRKKIKDEVVPSEKNEEVIKIKQKTKRKNLSTQAVETIVCDNIETVLDKTFIENMTNILDISPEHFSNITNGIISVKKDTRIRFNCNLCSKTYLHLDDCIAHKLIDHEGVEEPFKCSVCKKTFQTRKEWNMDLEKHSIDGNSCKICGKMVNNMYKDAKESNMQRHIRFNHTDYKLKIKLNSKLNSKLPRELHSCKECDYKTYVKGLFKKHLGSHILEKTFSCELCDKMFKTKDARKNHLSRYHTTEKPFECQKCDNKYAVKCFLKTHMLSHIPIEDRPYACDLCDKRYNKKALLERHKQLHTGEYKAICDTCGKGFRTTSNLKEHTQSMHSDEKPFKCDICGKGFKRKTTRSTHIKWHKKIVAARCPICNYGAITQSVINRHIKQVHTNETPFECDECGNKYKTKENLSKHKRGVRGSCKGFNTSEPSVKRKRESKTSDGKYYEKDEINQEDSTNSFQGTSLTTSHMPTLPNYGNPLLLYANSNNGNAYSTQYHGSLIPPNLRGITATVQTSHINY